MSGSEQLALLWIAERLGPAAQHIAVKHARHDKFFDFTSKDWRDLGLGEREAERLVEVPFVALQSRLDRLLESGGRIVDVEAGGFPYDLPLSAAMPPILFIRGEKPSAEKAGVAVVGSRKPSPYGREIAFRLGSEAAMAGLPLISGAALGIDTASHLGALESGGATVAVLGFGLFHCYPKSADKLLERIAQNGMVISQFHPQQRPDRRHFPIRNGLIAALSESVVVVEGLENSGARHTARHASKLGVKLFAVPGDISRPQSRLPNSLIADGAIALCRTEDVLDRGLPLGKPVAVLGAKKGKKSPVKRRVPDSGELEPLQKQLYEMIGKRETGADEILASGLGDPGKINEALLQLELSGFILQEPGRRYRLRG